MSYVHKIDAYRDGYRWVAYCVNCGQEDAALDGTECDQRYKFLENRQKAIDELKERKYVFDIADRAILETKG